MMMPLVFLGVFLVLQVVNARNHFDLVESGNGKMILNYNVTLGTNETFCLNVSSYAINGISPSATVSLISTNTVHKLYDASFTFFPSRQVIGGVSGFRIYKNSNVIARYPEPEWSRQYPFCKSTVLDVPTLEPFNEICIGNTCGAGKCLRDDFNNFWGQIQIDGYETNDFLTRDPVASICGEQTVGEVQYVAWTHRGEMVFNFQVTVNQSAVPLPQELVTYLNRRQPVAVSVNFTAANRANLSNFAVAFLYPDDTSQSFVNWPFSGIEADDSTCYGATIQAPDFKAGWNRVAIGSSCEGPYCGLETYTGSLIVHGHWTDADVDWIGTIDQSCYTVINTPTYAPTKDPPVTRGDVAAIILVSTIGSVIFVFAVWACVVGFRRLKRRYIVSDGKELNDPGCTWAGW